MVVDASAGITIKKLAAPHAFIDAIQQLDAYTGTWYLLYDASGVGTPTQGYCNVGALCWINMRLRNNGNAAGSIYLKITRTDNGAVIWNQSYSLAVNAYVDIDQINFIMPNSDLTLTFEIGHT